MHRQVRLFRGSLGFCNSSSSNNSAPGQVTTPEYSARCVYVSYRSERSALYLLGSFKLACSTPFATPELCCTFWDCASCSVLLLNCFSAVFTTHTAWSRHTRLIADRSPDTASKLVEHVCSLWKTLCHTSSTTRWGSVCEACSGADDPHC